MATRLVNVYELQVAFNSVKTGKAVPRKLDANRPKFSGQAGLATSNFLSVVVMKNQNHTPFSQKTDQPAQPWLAGHGREGLGGAVHLVDVPPEGQRGLQGLQGVGAA